MKTFRTILGFILVVIGVFYIGMLFEGNYEVSTQNKPMLVREYEENKMIVNESFDNYGFDEEYFQKCIETDLGVEEL